MRRVGTLIFGRPRRLPRDRRAEPASGTYTLICEEPVKLAKSYLAHLAPPIGNVSDVEVARRTAFDIATDRDYIAAAAVLDDATNNVTDPEVKGWLLEQKAFYQDHFSPVDAQETLAAARRLNRNVQLPLSGVAFKRRSPSADQAKAAAKYLSSRYSEAAELRAAMEVALEDLNFHEPDQTRAFRAEGAMKKVAEHIGLVAQRPDQETGVGPDVVWALGGLSYWVIELKTGSIASKISKEDVGQLSQAIDWFSKQYDQSCVGTPVMVHRSFQLTPEATARQGLVVIDAGKMEALRDAFRAYATSLAATDWTRPDQINKLLIGHGLRAADLFKYTRTVRAGR